MKDENIKLLITIPPDKAKALQEAAAQKGLSLAMYARMIVCDSLTN